MAEAITYADLRFVKAPLKKSVSSRLGQDPETDEDEELTYENVQVPSVSGGPLSLASSGVGDKAGLQSEQPTASWSSVTSPAAGRLLAGRAACMQYLFLGLLLTCLLLGVAAICLGVRYLQVSQQLQQTNRLLETTNSSLRQQLHLKMAQLGKKEEDLQGSRRELAQSQEALQEKQKVCQVTQEQLQACQSETQKTKEALQSKEVQRMTLEQRLNSMQDALKPLFTCPLADSCCPVGWMLNERSCFYISHVERSWEDSQNHCQSLSSELATFSDTSFSVSIIPLFADCSGYCLGEGIRVSESGMVVPTGDAFLFRQLLSAVFREAPTNQLELAGELELPNHLYSNLFLISAFWSTLQGCVTASLSLMASQAERAYIWGAGLLGLTP